MTEESVLITSDTGVHARPAMMLVRAAMKYPCEVYYSKDEMKVNGKSIMGVLALAITKGSELKIITDGDKEKEAVRELIHIIENDFKEGVV